MIGGFAGRIDVVLSGGGARGAYEAGALLAFQDAGVPTHIITATSVGPVNAASYAAHADGLVGNAEPLVETWDRLSPRTLGIEWTRYGWMVAGLIATSAGIGNLAWYLLTLVGLDVRLRYPALAWSALALAGLSVLLFFPQLPYVWFLLVGRLSRRGEFSLSAVSLIQPRARGQQDMVREQGGRRADRGRSACRRRVCARCGISRG